MIKSIGLLTRKDGLTHEDFVKHWLEVHAPLAHAVPGVRRYVQSHIVAERTHPPSRNGTCQCVARRQTAARRRCVSIANSIGLFAPYLELAAACTVFGDPRATCAWGPPNDCRGIAVPGGYRVTGRWDFRQRLPARSAIDGRTTRHPGHAVSGRMRKRIEEVFGWAKGVAGFRQTHHRGLARVGWMFTLTATAYCRCPIGTRRRQGGRGGPHRQSAWSTSP